MFPCYQPWSPELWRLVRRCSWHGQFYMLDVQLGSDCNARCEKCDSSCCETHEPAELDVDAVARFAAEMRANYDKMPHLKDDPDQLQGFICGLGEPTAGENLQKLKDLVDATKKYGFNWAFFNNGIYWDDELSKMLQDGQISVQVQCNGSDVAYVAKELGRSETIATQQIENRKRLYHEGYSGRQIRTNVCASIVPQRDNIDYVRHWVAGALAYRVFPLLGELEEAGLCTGERYQAQCLSSMELSALKHWLLEELGWDYKVPFCPATVGAIHVNNRNMVTVDEKTGLSCGWPGMTGAGSLVLGDIRTESLAALSRSVLEYRLAKIESVRNSIYQYPHMVFGGCGGNVRYLLQDYVASYDEFVAGGG